MSRMARAVASGFPHHVVQKGNNREPALFDEEDRVRYLYLFKKYSTTWNLPVPAYSLMTNHMHPQAKPQADESLYK